MEPTDTTAVEAPDPRFEELAALADGLVHDLRNPLNVIRTNAYLLRQRVSPEDVRAGRALERIDTQVNAATRILEGLEAFYRCDRPNCQRVDVNEIVRSIAADERPAEGVLETSLEEQLPLVTADPRLLVAALRALLRNAREAAGAGSLVRVLTRRAAEGISLEVHDQGPGIPEELLPQVRRAFFSTRHGQSGLGLALVEGVARVHAGTLELRLGADGGQVAALVLPAAGQPAPMSPAGF